MKTADRRITLWRWGLLAALLQRDDITPDQLNQMEELLRQRSAKK